MGAASLRRCCDYCGAPNWAQRRLGGNVSTVLNARLPRAGRCLPVSWMTDQVTELQAARDHIEQLVHAIVEIGSDLDLHGTLHRIVKAAIELLERGSAH